MIFAIQQLISFILSYCCSGNVTGAEPKSMVAKISGVYDRKLSLLWRFLFYYHGGKNVDEMMNNTKREQDFFQRIVPITKATQLRTPDVYFVGLDSKEQSCIQFVVLKSLSKTRGVILMEDLR